MRKFTLLGLCVGVLLLSAPIWAQSDQTQQPQSQSQAQAQTWTGTLGDADCKATDANAKCEITENTKSFGLTTGDGKYVKLDDKGNAKVRSALMSNPQKTGSVKASISGSMDGDTLKVDSVQIQ